VISIAFNSTDASLRASVAILSECYLWLNIKLKALSLALGMSAIQKDWEMCNENAN